MGIKRFDILTRSLTIACSRRGVLATVLVGALGLSGIAETAAKKGKGKKKKKHRGNSSPPPPPQSPPPPPPPRGPLTRTFANPAAITIPGAGTGSSTGSPASPYPSTIEVSGFTNGVITDVNVSLNNFSHTCPSDVDVLLAATHISGRNAIIMSDAGGAGDPVNVNLVLDDAAVLPLPTVGPIVSDTFRPTNSGGSDAFPAPTPTGNSLLSTFNGQNPNGAWQLFIVDGANGDTGSLTLGWALRITAEVDLPAGAQGSAAAKNRKNKTKRQRRGKGRR